MLKWLLPIFLAILIAVGIYWGYNKSPKSKAVCDQPYALCTSAQCIPDPSNPKKVICFCKVHEGKSFGFKSCSARTPSGTGEGLRRLTSTFSLEEFSSSNVMTCASGNPWGDCLDQPCVVDPFDPGKAICSCKLVKSDIFQTLGGNCDTSTCQQGFWSAATLEVIKESIQAMKKHSGPDKPQVNYCRD